MRVSSAAVVALALHLGKKNTSITNVINGASSSPNPIVLASENWNGVVSVEIEPLSTAVTVPQQHAHAVDSEEATKELQESDNSIEGIPSLPDSIRSGAIQTAHACLMAGAYTIVFPLGAIATHIGPSGRGRTNIHMYCQLTGILMIIIGFGIGCWMAVQTGIVKPQSQGRLNSEQANLGSQDWNAAHPQLGTALIALTIFQPFIGFIHQRFAISHKEYLLMWNIHAWYGRCLMAVAIIQGGIGLQLANKYSPHPLGALAAFLTISLLMLLIYSIMMFRNRGRRKRRIDRRMVMQKQMLLQKQKQSQPQRHTPNKADRLQELNSPLKSPISALYHQTPQSPAMSNFSRPMTPRPRTPKTSTIVSGGTNKSGA